MGKGEITVRIGFDFHGVLEKYPNVFKPLIQLLDAIGAEVCVVSGPTLDEIDGELTKYGYNDGIASIHSVIDFLKQNNVKTWQDEKGTWWAADEDWWSSKAKMCKENDIDIMIDDSEKYAPYFDSVKTEFIMFKDCNFKEMLTRMMAIFGVNLNE